MSTISHMPSFVSQKIYTKTSHSLVSMSITTAPVSSSDAIATATSSTTHTMCATSTALAQMSATSDRATTTKLMIPTIVATFLLATSLTLCLAYFLIRRRRRRLEQTLNLSKTSQTSQTHSTIGHWDDNIFSPLSPNDTSNTIFFVGATPLHEVEGGQRTPMEVLGDTTWAKGEWSKDVGERVDQPQEGQWSTGR